MQQHSHISRCSTYAAVLTMPHSAHTSAFTPRRIGATALTQHHICSFGRQAQTLGVSELAAVAAGYNLNAFERNAATLATLTQFNIQQDMFWAMDMISFCM